MTDEYTDINNGKEEESQENRKNDEQKFTVQEKIIDRQQKVYQLHLQGYTNQEIADKLNVSLSTIEKDLHYIKNEWRDRLKLLIKTGYYELYLDTRTQTDMVLKELWQMYVKEDNVEIKSDLLSSIFEKSVKMLAVFKGCPTPRTKMEESLLDASS